MGGSHERTSSSMAGHGVSPEKREGKRGDGERHGARLHGVGKEGAAPGGRLGELGPLLVVVRGCCVRKKCKRKKRKEKNGKIAKPGNFRGEK
jgi:hypothetical protein